MRKIIREHENPLDNINIDISDKLCPFFKKMNFTPNGITTLSLIFGIISIIFLLKCNVLFFAITYYISYFFDCMDGHYARKYKMTSKGGDLYDHIKDVSINFILALIILFYFKYPRNKKIVLIILIILMFTLMSIHLGCQEKIYDSDESSTLNFTKNMCKNPEKYIKFTRFFGCATWTIFIILVVIYVNKIKK